MLSRPGGRSYGFAMVYLMHSRLGYLLDPSGREAHHGLSRLTGGGDEVLQHHPCTHTLAADIHGQQSHVGQSSSDMIIIEDAGSMVCGGTTTT